MNKQLKLSGLVNHTEFLLQRVTFFNSLPLRGVIECPEMLQQPCEDVFTLHPFNLTIRVSLTEPKQPEFVVISAAG